MRQTPQDLGGSIRITPQASPHDTFIGQGPSQFVPREIIDLVPLSNLLAQKVGRDEAEAAGLTKDVLEDIGRKVESGGNLETILKEYSESGDTPSRVKSKLAKLFTKDGISPAANPAFLLAYEEGRGEIKAQAADARMSTPEVQAEIAQAGIDAGAEGATDAMLAAIRGKLESFGLYDDLGVFGRAAVDRRVMDIAAGALANARKVYLKQVEQGYEDDFGGSTILAARALTEATTDEQTAAVLRDFNERTKTLLTVHPQGRKVLQQSIEAAAEELKSTRGVAAAIEFLDDAISGVTDANGNSLFDPEDIDDPADLIGLARLRQLQESFRQSKSVENRLKAEEDELARLEARDELDKQFGDAIFRAANTGSTKLRETLQEIGSAIQDLYPDDPKKAAAARDWFLEEQRKSNQIASFSGREEQTAGEIQAYIRAGDFQAAREYLTDARSGNLITFEDYTKLKAELEEKEQYPEIYRSSDYGSIQSRVARALSNVDFYAENPSSLDRDTIQLTLEVQDAVDEWVEEGLAAGKSPAKLAAGLDRFINRTLLETSNKLIGEKPPPDQTTIQRLEERKKLEAFTNQSPVDIAGKAPTLGGGVARIADIPEVKELSLRAKSFWFTRPISDIEFDPKRSGLTPRSVQKAREYLFRVSEILDDKDMVDTAGNPVNEKQRRQLAHEALAYAGMFTMEELTLRESLPEKWANLGRRSIEVSMLHTLSLDNADFLRIPVAEVPLFMDTINQDTRTLKASRVKEVEPVRALLESFNQPSSDEAVAAYIIKQYELQQALK